MKKIVSTLVALATVLMPFGALSVSAADAAGVELTVKKVAAEAGQEITVPIEVTSNAGVVALNVQIEYDKTLLTLTKVEDGKLFSGASYTPGGDLTAVPYKLLFEDALATENYTDIGNIAILTFKVADNASGLAEVKLTVNEAFNVDMDDVAATVVDGGVQVGGETVVTTTAPAATTTTTTTTTTITTTSAAATTTTTTTSAAATTTTTTTSAAATTTTTTTTEAPVTTTTTTTTEAPVTTTTTTTTAVETTAAAVETTTDKEANYLVSADEFAEWAKTDYEDKNEGAKVASTSTKTEDGVLVITLLDAEGNVLDVYSIDPTTGKGVNQKNADIDLPQTGVNSVKAVAAVGGAIMMLAAGAWMTVGTLRKKDEE